MAKSKKIAIVGIGRVGLPLALVLAQEGYEVFGIGRDQSKMDELKKGTMPFQEKGAGPLLKKFVNKTFFPTTDYQIIKNCDYIILTLGTPIDENMNPVYNQIDSALSSMKPFLKKSQTLILRSTVAPRTTQYVEHFLNDIKDIEVGRNFYLAFCPERIAEGFAIEETKSIPQIVGGIDKISTRRAAELFSSIGVEVLETDAVSAELSKLFTNMYRYIKFAIANEFMYLAENYNRDIYEIVNLVNHNYARGGLSLPGLTGGPCLFKDGFFLVSDIPFSDLITTSWKINESVPLHLIKQVRERMKLEGKKAVVLGLGFKGNSDDIRESLSFKFRKALLRENALVTLSDPHITGYKNQEIEKDLYKAVVDADVIFIGANHNEYKNIDVKKLIKLVKKRCIVCDVWNVLGTNKIVFTASQLLNNGQEHKK